MKVLYPGKSYSKMYGIETGYNDLRYNDILDTTMCFWRTDRKIVPDITILLVHSLQSAIKNKIHVSTTKIY